MLNVDLNVVSGKHKGQVITLNRPKFLIGREQDCQLRPNSELVSRHHCVFTVDDFSVRIRDLGSTNGTMVNGERIRKEVVLQQGDRVIVGNLEFEVVIGDKAGEDAPQLPTTAEDTVVAGSETISELPAIQTPSADTAESAQAAPAPVVPQPIPAETGPGAGDTTVIEQPAIMPGQVPYQGMMPQMGYPMYGYPFQGMPGQMPMYPPGYMMPGQMYGQPPAAEPSAPSEERPKGDANISLPDPSTTGAKDDPPKPAASGEGEKKSSGKESTGAADAIIKQYMQRRPPGAK
ncbi:MAG: FHA domain-containing protein [Planctomycetaceae bacterium]|nr:FHA domain-containing protein [Planctomycetaceae bacterium]